jgi:DNA-3-methyladenine glycosylase II
VAGARPPEPPRSLPRVAIAATNEAYEHLRSCEPVMGALVESLGPLDEQARRRGRPDDAYGALVRAIAGQQLSVKAAATIYGRVTDLYGGKTPTPAQLIATDPEDLRAAGLSYSKAAYLRDLAERIEDGDLDLGALSELSDREVSEMLIQVKGLGQWTIDVFMIFHLGRPDVLPVGDLGVRRAAERAYNLRKLPSPERLTRLARPWRPYRSLASLYLWESLANAPDA